jgi:hypothetical protein
MPDPAPHSATEPAVVSEAEAEMYWQCLKEWPFAYGRLFDGPRPEVIEAHGIAHLYRALNIGRLTAFVGSGTSLAYGRISWRGLLDVTRDAVLASPTVRNSPRAQTSKLRELLEEQGKNTAGPAQQLAVFQLAESLSKEIGERWFTQQVQWLVHDDRAHLELLIRKTFPTLSDDDIARGLWGEAPNDPRLSHRWLPRPSRMTGASPNTPELGNAAEFDELLNRPLTRYRILASWFALDEARRGDVWERFVEHIRNLRESTGAGAYATRRHAPRPGEHDPLRILLRDLRVNRFLTSNYDREIERLFMDEGYLRTRVDGTVTPSTRADPLASTFVDVVFSGGTTGELTVLASADRSRSGWVAYLHGRSELDGSGEVIATEEHYRHRYARNDKTRAAVDDALRLAYSASPILFVGVGLEEVDLLHPLRQLLSMPTRVGDRVAISLDPELKDKRETAARQIELLQKYGIYSIPYGSIGDIPVLHHAKTIENHVTTRLAADLKRQKASTAARGTPRTVQPAVRALARAKESLRDRAATSAIDLLLDAVRVAAGAPSAASADLLQRHIMQVQGAFTELNTILLCQRLISLRKGWDTWWEAWQRLPSPRKVLTRTPTINGHKTLRRHVVELLAADRLGVVPYTQTVESFLRALDSREAALQAAEGLRVFVLAAPRGGGRGHFLTALQSEISGAETREPPVEVVAPSPGQRRRPTGYLPQLLKLLDRNLSNRRVAIYNLGLSLEVSSLGDSLAEFLWSALPSEARTAHAVARRSFSHDRLGLLQFVLRTLSEQPKQPRMTIIINAANLLFDSTGRPKNQQLQALFTILLSHGTAPIDVMLLCTESGVPIWFRRAGQPAQDDGRRRSTDHCESLIAAPEQLIDPELSVRSQQAAAELMDSRFRSRKCDRGEAGRVRTYIHLLKPDRASAFVSAYFPGTSLALAVDLTAGDPEQQNWGNRAFEAVLGTAASEPSRRLIQDVLSRKCGVPAIEERDAAAMVAAAASAGWNAMLGGDLRRAQGDVLDDRFGRIQSAVGGGRFIVTLLMATIDEMLEAEWTSSDAGFAQRPRALGFLDDVIISGERVSQAHRTDLAIDRVLRRLAERHECLERLPGALSGLDHLDQGMPLFRLQETLLWHIAVIGHPVEAAVLAECPKVVQAVEDARLPVRDARRSGEDGRGAGEVERLPLTLDERTDTVRAVLRLLLHRCLVFRIRPSNATSRGRRIPQGDEEKHARFTTHRLVQRHLLRRMGAPAIEHPAVDRLSLTLYATQPNDVAALSTRIHEELRAAVAVLSGYPDHDNAAVWFARHSTEGRRGPDERPRMLRAAYGILRSVYSVASVVRYQASAAVPTTGEHEPGLIEVHRQQLRWLLGRARDLRKGPQKPDGVRYAPPDPSRTSPFYAEEITWIYNESAVLSLLQGHLKDALALFTLADRSARSFEPRPGPVRSIIQLNRIVGQIEQGKLATARASLSELLDEDSERRFGVPEDVKLISRGYRALVAHLTGYGDEAEREYQAVIRGLMQQRLSRAASIFCRHYAELLRSRAGSDASVMKRAVDMIETSIRLAAEDHHEDVRHLALLSEARIKLRGADAGISRRIHAMLDEIEAYARTMGMPILSCEVDEVRARVHRHNGDLKAASSHASSSLEVAAFNDLGLRRATLLVLLAEINFDRGMPATSRALLQGALGMGADLHHHEAVTGAQRLADQLRGATVNT